MTALLGWTPVIVKLLVSITIGHLWFNYRGCPDLNLRQISQSESEAQGIHQTELYYFSIHILGSMSTFLRGWYEKIRILCKSWCMQIIWSAVIRSLNQLDYSTMAIEACRETCREPIVGGNLAANLVCDNRQFKVYCALFWYFTHVDCMIGSEVVVCISSWSWLSDWVSIATIPWVGDNREFYITFLRVLIGPKVHCL